MLQISIEKKRVPLYERYNRYSLVSEVAVAYWFRFPANISSVRTAYS